MLPKNSGLEKYTTLLETLSLEKVIARGEDVPLFVEKLAENGTQALGLTGEDLFKEYSLLEKTNLEIKQRIPWADSSAIFKKPTICLMGKGKLKEDSIIAINSKYKTIASEFLKGKKVRPIYLNGCTETAFVKGIADFVIDIVYSGKSAKMAGLDILKPIFESDVVLIGVKE